MFANILALIFYKTSQSDHNQSKRVIQGVLCKHLFLKLLSVKRSDSVMLSNEINRNG